MAKYKKMMDLFEFTYNSKNYREALKSAKPPAVPYLGKVNFTNNSLKIFTFRWPHYFLLFFIFNILRHTGLIPRDITSAEEIPTFVENGNFIFHF